ncbi:Thioredoxin [Actinomyces naeslundii]|uniref:tetratricopeptide repeat protein n=3 Tax=Actinomyces TaxID=1654 RepID=UPI00195DC43C|nr:tetratricopeptide repeat protein [Actinomyces naeslundii]VTX69225.1 Thioredoxin [Actinomyces naeslundii]
MSMFGAVDLSSLAPATKPAGSTGATPSPATGDRPTGAAGSGLPVPLVVDVDASNLREVAEVSTQVPVIVVLHSPRSQASADLAAVLEELADQYAGRFQLARVNVDTAPEVAQALQAQAVPTVVALIAGQPVPMFQGAVPQEQLRSVIDQLLEVAAANGVNGTIAVDGAVGAVGAGTAEAEPEETEVERAAREAIEAGDFAAAEEVYTHAIAQNPGDDDLKVARNQVRLMARLDGQDPHELLAAADAAPTDLAAALAGADAALALGDVNAALGRALEAVRTHAGEEREEARLRLLELFEVIGSTSPEVAQARRRLATMLY